MRDLLVRAAVAIVLVAAVKWLVTRVEPSLVFFPVTGETVNPRALGLEYRDLTVHTSDGESIRAWWMPHEAALADIVYFHGNGGNLSVWLPVLAGVRSAGLNVLAFDYRGYGRSTGAPSEQGLYRDADAILESLHRLRQAGGATDGTTATGRPVIYWGRSLGGAVAAYAASRRAPDGLVLESTFAEKGAVIRGNLLLRTLNLLASYRFETAAMLRGFAGPTLVLHGEADTVIPYAAGRELFEHIEGSKRFVHIGGDHNDLHPATDRDYWSAITELVSQARNRAKG